MGIRYTLDTCLHQKCRLEATNEDDDDTNQSVSSIEDDFVTAFEHLEEEETSKPYNDGINITALRSQCDAASQTISGHRLETHDFRVLVGSGWQKSLAKPSASLISILGHKELPSVKPSVTTSVSEPWVQRSFYRSSTASDKDSDADVQKQLFSSSPAYSSESECSSPSPVIFLDEEGYQKSLKAKLELPKIPVMKDDIEDSDSEVSEFFDSFDQFDELEQTLESACPFLKDPAIGKLSPKKGHKHEKLCSVTTTMNPQKFKFDRPALPANVRKPTPRKPESPYSNLCDAPDSPRPVKASGEDSGLFSPIRSSAFSPLGGCTSAECFCQTDIGEDRIHENHDSVYYTYEDYADSLSCEVLGSVLYTQHTNATSNINGIKKGENKMVALKCGSLDQKSKSKNKSSMIKDSIQKFAADLVEKSFGSAFKDLQKGVFSCTNALCQLAVKLTSSVFQMAFNELRRQRAFSLKERAISGLANFLVSEAFANALKDLQYVKKQIFTNTVARFAADLAEELVFEGIMEVCQFSYPPTPASPQCLSFDYEDKVVKSYAKDLSESVIQEAFIELSQVDVTFTTKAAVSVSTDNIKYVSAENVVPSTQTSTFSPTSNGQTIMVTKPVQEYKKEYTVQQALFCTSGVVTSIPVPLAGSALLPYHVSSNMYQAKSHPSSDDSNLNGLTYKYPSCESVTDEYAGHIIQILKQEGGDSELIMDQYANRLAYRSVKSGLQEASKTAKMKCNSKMFPVQSSQVKTNDELLLFLSKEHQQGVDKKRQSKISGGYLHKNPTCEWTRDTCRNECLELYSFSTSLAHNITKDVKKELTTSTVGLPKSLTDSCLYEKNGCDEDAESHLEPEFPASLQPSSQNHRFSHSTGSLSGCGYGETVVQAIEQYANKVVDDALELSSGSVVFHMSETTKAADRVTYAEKLSPLVSQACRYCDRKELHDCTGNSCPRFPRPDSLASSKPVSNSKFSNIYQKSRIFHLDVPQIHIDLDKKTVLAEKIVAEAIEKAERELSSTSLAADSGIGQDGVIFAESLTTEIMTSAMRNVGQAVSRPKEIEDFQSTESFGSQQMNLSIGDDSTGSWSNLSFEDEHQDESSSFHHLSESNGNSSSWSSLGLEGDLYEDNLSFPTSDSDGPDDRDEEHEDDVE
ncbi:A-kinase anchor protein 11, partial [Eschrichtius robustus]|nr:A-kinase anchor protein 11 [Eschrichtius robustus]